LRKTAARFCEKRRWRKKGPVKGVPDFAANAVKGGSDFFVVGKGK